MRLVRLGYSCNNACVFCAQGNLRVSKPASSDVAIRAELAQASGEIVAFVGGEPTLHEALLDWAQAAKEAGARAVLVQTNGRRLAYSSYATALAEAGIDALDISLQGSNAAMHDYHTSVPGSFSQTLTGIANAQKLRLPVGVTTVVTRSNFRHLPEIVRTAHSRGANAIHFSLVAPIGRAEKARDRLRPPLPLVQPHLISALSLARSLGLETLAHPHASSEKVRDRFAGLGFSRMPTT